MENDDLDSLAVKLEAARNRNTDVSDSSKKPQQGGFKAFAIGTRVASDVIAAVLVGAAIGWGLDALFGTKPIFFAVFILFGIAAGIISSYRLLTRKSDPDAKD